MLYIWSSIVLYRFCWRFRRGWDSACPRSRVSMKTVVVDPRSPIAGRCSTPTRAEKWRLVGGQHAWNSGENLGRLDSQCGECLSNQLHLIGGLYLGNTTHLRVFQGQRTIMFWPGICDLHPCWRDPLTPSTKTTMFSTFLNTLHDDCPNLLGSEHWYGG